MKITKKLLVSGLVAFAVVATPAGVLALDTANSRLSQEIISGALTTSIRDSSGEEVDFPTFHMDPVTASTSVTTSTGTFGDNERRVTVDNPGATSGSWTLTWNATSPGSSTWSSGAAEYAYNGVTEGEGQLTVDPTVGTLTSVTGGSAGITTGGVATFTGTTPITLLAAGAGASNFWNGYITGIELSQTIPASQPLGTYTLDMTQTVTGV